jgi:hypothetical protein
MESSPITAGGLTLYFDKSPDLFTITCMKFSDALHVGFFQGDELKGFASCGFSEGYINGNVEKIFTLYNFYLLKEARGKRLPQKAMKEFVMNERNKAVFGTMVTMKGNRQAESFIGRQGYSWIPPSRIIGDLVIKSIIFAFPKKNRTNYLVRKARIEDIPDIVRLLNQEHVQRDFGTVFREEDFEHTLTRKGLVIEDYYVATDKNGEIKGTCLAWDCSLFRRTKVLNYSIKFYPTLIAYKILQNILPMLPFPGKGKSFRELTITDYAVAGRDPVIMKALLSEIYHRNCNRRFHFLNFASCANDPLLSAANGFWHQNIVSNIVLTSLDPNRFQIETPLPYVDIAFL